MPKKCLLMYSIYFWASDHKSKIIFIDKKSNNIFFIFLSNRVWTPIKNPLCLSKLSLRYGQHCTWVGSCTIVHLIDMHSGVKFKKKWNDVNLAVFLLDFFETWNPPVDADRQNIKYEQLGWVTMGPSEN